MKDYIQWYLESIIKFINNIIYKVFINKFYLYLINIYIESVYYNSVIVYIIVYIIIFNYNYQESLCLFII